MSYIAYVEQADDGCDYTIGCAQTLWRLEARDLESAIQELRDEVIGKFCTGEDEDYVDGYWGIFKLKRVTLFTVTEETKIPLSTWYTEAEKQAQEYKATASDEADRAEFERLKKKLGE